MIYVLAHNLLATPSGGLNILFRISEGLVKAGLNAKLITPHPIDEMIPHNLSLKKSSYRPVWMDSSVEMVCDLEMITSDDIVFIHEEAIWAYDMVKRCNPKHVMINQGIQSTMMETHGVINTYNQVQEMYASALGVVTVSEYISEGINILFNIPKNKIFTLNNVNTISNVFEPGIKHNKILILIKDKEGISPTTTMIVKVIKERYLGWDVQLLHEMSQVELAAAMAESKIFVFFCASRGEGFGLPPIEAAISGCKVIGYSGLGGRPYYEYPNFTEIEYNDVNGFVQALDVWTEELKDKSILEYNDRARFIQQKLSKQRNIDMFYDDVKTITQRILNG